MPLTDYARLFPTKLLSETVNPNSCLKWALCVRTQIRSKGEHEAPALKLAPAVVLLSKPDSSRKHRCDWRSLPGVIAAHADQTIVIMERIAPKFIYEMCQPAPSRPCRSANSAAPHLGSRRNGVRRSKCDLHNKLCWINASSDNRKPGSSRPFDNTLKTLGRRRGTLCDTHDIKTFSINPSIAVPL